MSSFIDRFSSLMAAQSLSQKAIADSMGLTPRALRFYLSGDREPSMSTLIALADYFDVSLDYLVGRSDK